MELHQLRYLVAVVDTGSFTAAAAREHVSQSGVSAQIAKLEHELGQPLLRRGRGSTLTPAGEAVLPLARDVLDGVAAISTTAQEVRQVLRGRVRLGMIVGCAIPPFLDAIAEFRAEHPGVDLSLHEDDSPLLQQQVLTGGLDLALVSLGAPARDGLVVRQVSDERLVVVLPDGHPLRRRRVRLADLRHETLLCLPQGTGIRTAFERACALAEIDLPVQLHASSPETLIELTRRGAGVCVLTASMVAASGLTSRPLVDAEASAGLALVAPPDATPAAQAMLASLDRRLRPSS